MIITESAAIEIRRLVARPDVPDESGIRITDTGHGTLTLSLAVEPDVDDTVLDDAGARVFLEPAAGELLANRMLDAGVDPQGQVQFSLAARR